MSTNNKLGLVCVVIGFLLRVYLSTTQSGGLGEWLQTRVEISTPVSSWPRAREGIYMKRVLGVSPYDGDLVHEMPIMLEIYQLLTTMCSVNYMFIIVDCINAFLVYHLVTNLMAYSIQLEQFNQKMGRYAKFERLNEIILSHENYDQNVWPLFATCVYLFNPFSLASCIGMSTVVIHNLLLLLSIHFLLKPKPSTLLCLLFLAVHANVTVYSVTLIAPTLSFLAQKRFYLDNNKQSQKQEETSQVSLFYITHSLGFVILCGLVFGLNYILAGFDTQFIHSTYLFVIRVPDLAPNSGLWWYFLTEMFEHFAHFFTFVFQLNAFVYAVPLTVRLIAHPAISLLIQVGLLSVIKSYPNVGETGLYIALLVPLFAYLFRRFMRNFLVYSCMLLVSVILAPCMFYLWLGSGGGNANFYFAITLVFSTGQFFLLADVLYAHLKREFCMANGDECPYDSINQTRANLSLD